MKKWISNSSRISDLKGFSLTNNSDRNTYSPLYDERQIRNPHPKNIVSDSIQTNFKTTNSNHDIQEFSEQKQTNYPLSNRSAMDNNILSDLDSPYRQSFNSQLSESQLSQVQRLLAASQLPNISKPRVAENIPNFNQSNLNLRHSQNGNTMKSRLNEGNTHYTEFNSSRSSSTFNESPLPDSLVETLQNKSIRPEIAQKMTQVDLAIKELK